MSTSFTSLPTTVTTLATSDILAGDISGITSKITAGNMRKAFFGFAAADPLNCGPATIVGNSTITGTLGGITTLTCTTLVATNLTANVTGNVTGSSGSCTGNAATATTAGTVTAAAQPSITSVGTLTAVTVSGTVTLSAATSKIVPGATSLSFRNNADGADNLILTDAGVATIRAGLTLAAGNLTFGAAAGKVIPGATTLDFRNTGDTGSILLLSNSGNAVQISNGRLTLTGGSVLGTAGAALLIASQTAPSSPVDGEMWYDGAAVKFRVGGTTKTFTLT